jgi:hypothetical protein
MTEKQKGMGERGVDIDMKFKFWLAECGDT